MYWLNMSKLAEDLRDDRVDEKERLKYFLANFIAWTILIQTYVYVGGPLSVDRLVRVVFNRIGSRHFTLTRRVHPPIMKGNQDVFTVIFSFFEDKGLSFHRKPGK